MNTKLKIVNVTFYSEGNYEIMTDKIIYRELKNLTSYIDGKMGILKGVKTYSVKPVKAIDVDIVLI